MKFHVYELVCYEVEAESCEAAEQQVTDNEERDLYCIGVNDRYAVPLDDQGDPTDEDCQCPSCLASADST